MPDKVLGVLSGRDMSDASLLAWVRDADVVYAADSAADRLIHLGERPIVVGDLDSFESHDRAEGLRVVRDPDQNSTDCDKLLRLAAMEGHEAITMASIEGDLLDHVLATLSSLVASPLEIRIALRRGVGWIVRAGREVAVEAVPGQRVSLVPLEGVRGARLTGVVWPLDAADLAPGAALSISNEALGRVCARTESGAALLFVEYSSDDLPFW